MASYVADSLLQIKGLTFLSIINYENWLGVKINLER